MERTRARRPMTYLTDIVASFKMSWPARFPKYLSPREPTWRGSIFAPLPTGELRRFLVWPASPQRGPELRSGGEGSRLNFACPEPP